MRGFSNCVPSLSVRHELFPSFAERFCCPRCTCCSLMHTCSRRRWVCFFIWSVPWERSLILGQHSSVLHLNELLAQLPCCLTSIFFTIICDPQTSRITMWHIRISIILATFLDDGLEKVGNLGTWRASRLSPRMCLLCCEARVTDGYKVALKWYP